MSFRNKLLLCVGGPTLAFLVALALLGWTLQRAQTTFNHYISHDQRIETTLRDMYAQGLQMGQALRNIVLDPGNQKAYKNLETAQEQFGKSHTDLTTLAQGAGMESSAQRLGALRQTLDTQQKAVLNLVSTDAEAAKQLLVSAETPAWRELRSALLDDIDAYSRTSQKQFAHTQAQLNRWLWACALLAAASMLAAIGFTISLLRTIQHELGAEPAELKNAMSALAQGDLTVTVHSHPLPAHLPPNIGTAFNRTITQLSQTIHGVRQRADGITQASQEIAQGNLDLSART